MELNTAIKSYVDSTEEVIPDAKNFLLVFLDSFFYTSLEKVTGEVVLTTQLSGLSLLLEAYGGEEIVLYDGNKKIIEKKTKEVFNVNHIAGTIDSPGQYVAPFSLKLPSHSPSSFSYSYTDTRGYYIQSSIFYMIKATLLNSQPILSQSQIFNVKNLQSSYLTKFQSDHLLTINGCCASSGTTQVQLEINNKDLVELNTPLYLSLKINNETCSQTISQIKLDVLMNFSSNIENIRSETTHLVTSDTKQVSITGHDKLIYKLPFFLPTDLNPCSMSTSILNCEFFIECTFSYQSMCLSQVSSFRTGFHVDPQNNASKTMPELPDDWNPSELPISVLLWS